MPLVNYRGLSATACTIISTSAHVGQVLVESSLLRAKPEVSALSATVFARPGTSRRHHSPGNILLVPNVTTEHFPYHENAAYSTIQYRGALLRVNQSLEVRFTRALRRHAAIFEASTLQGSWIVTWPHILYSGRPPRRLTKDDLFL